MLDYLLNMYNRSTVLAREILQCTETMPNKQRGISSAVYKQMHILYEPGHPESTTIFAYIIAGKRST